MRVKRKFALGEFLFRAIGYNVYGFVPGAILGLVLPPVGAVSFFVFNSFVLKEAYEQERMATVSRSTYDSPCYEYGSRGGRYTMGRSWDGGEYKRYR